MILGHQKQWEFLKKTLEIDRLSHAYLFSGLESLGKKTLALQFIKLINCQNPDAEEKPCEKCDNCKMIEKKNFPDLFIVKPEEDSDGESRDGIEGTSISISQIRDIQHFLSFKPYYGRWKSVIIDQSEKMTQEAQSCLLKTLEEAKGKVLLILISSRPETLLPTISSRCQTIKFFPVSQSEIKNYLLNQEVSDKKAEFLTKISQGRPGRAINFFLTPQGLEEKMKFLEEFSKVCQSDLATRFISVKNLISKNSNLREILGILQDYFRYLLFLKIGIMQSSDLSDFPPPSEKIKSYSVVKIKKIIQSIENFNFLLSSTNLNQKLALEILFMGL